MVGEIGTSQDKALVKVHVESALIRALGAHDLEKYHAILKEQVPSFRDKKQGEE